MIELVETPESSNLNLIGYDVKNQQLIIEFKNENRYHYQDVPIEIYNEMLTVESKGKFLAEKIKGIYRYYHVNGD